MVKRVPELMLPHIAAMEEIMFDLDLIVLSREAARKLSAVTKAAKNLTVAISYIHSHNQHGEPQNYITVPEIALRQLNEALATLEEVKEP